MSSSLDNEFPYITNHSKSDLDTLMMQDELLKLQRKYNDKRTQLILLNDEKASQFTDSPSTNIPQTISLEVNPPISNKYQNQIYDPSPIPESESCEIDNQTIGDSLYSITPTLTPIYSPLTTHQLIIPNQKQSINTKTQNSQRNVYKFKPMPNKPIPPVPTKQRQNKDNKFIPISNTAVKWVNFIARVKCHQSKQIYKTFNYHKNGYEENTNIIMNRLNVTNKNIDNGSLIINGKLFVFIRNLYCQFPYEMILRTNNNNQYDAMKFLNKIVKQTKSSIQQMNIYDIGTFDYDLHFDNIMHKLMSLH